MRLPWQSCKNSETNWKSDKGVWILDKFLSLRLKEEFSTISDAYEVKVFRKFVSKIMSFQKQFDYSYHNDKFLWDRLTTAVDIPSIQLALRGWIPRRAQQLANRIANRLLAILRTAGVSMVHYPSSATVLILVWSNQCIHWDRAIEQRRNKW